MIKRKTIFFPAKSKELARIVDITSPSAFRRSIRILKRQGITLTEKRALVLAQNRVRVQLSRKNLSLKERKQFREIIKIRLPKISRR